MECYIHQVIESPKSDYNVIEFITSIIRIGFYITVRIEELNNIFPFSIHQLPLYRVESFGEAVAYLMSDVDEVCGCDVEWGVEFEEVHSVMLERDIKEYVHGWVLAYYFSEAMHPLGFVVVSRRFYATSTLPSLDDVPIGIDGLPVFYQSARHIELDKK